MGFKKTRLNFVLMVCVIAIVFAASIIGQSTTSVQTSSASAPEKSIEVQTGQSAENMNPIDMISPDDAILKNTQTGYWTCTMHPDIHQPQMGNCPVCGMILVFRKSGKYTTRMSSVDDSTIR